MKKILLFILILLSLMACKKNKVCWSCQNYTTGTLVYETKCDHGSGHFKDQNGNDQQCIEIH